ncbi:DUF2237 family protein [Ornithinimicrobium tianjinense]|uniref:DUF2237 domain-containing protein n=1 Tax=Ornithinimicrobium tianjinense TaxID=1195761 RepID=A0A917BQG4_9MICO|nr:DUF2237 domain-containing protein [Ornithinimicrobium tianjinense]GGF53369.1 hypothetical protein GCM10011366_21430 [Ornithinimicrobium tianjinense]
MRNVLGGELEECGTDPVTGFTRTGRCEVTVEDVGIHGICVVVTADFLEHQSELGNDLVTPRPEWSFPGLRPGDRWCVVALRWVQSASAGRAAPVVLASTHESVLQVAPLELLQAYAVDVPDDLSGLA